MIEGEEKLARGVDQPDGFNLSVIDDPLAREAGVMLVEGPLDALACTEMGHPAVAVLRAAPGASLAKRLRRSGLNAYLALDGTDDVTRLSRCRAASTVGRLTRVCVLSGGKDPDELTAADLKALKDAARPVLDEWLSLLVSTGAAKTSQDAPESLRQYRHELAASIREWLVEEPGAAAEIRQAVCKALGMTDSEYQGWIGNENNQSGRQAETSQVEEVGVEQPPPMCLPPSAMNRSGDAPEAVELTNFRWEKRGVKNKKGEIEEKEVPIALDISTIRRRILKELAGWPCRLYSPDSPIPLLFYVTVDGARHWLRTPKRFLRFLHDYFKVKFLPERDADLRNFVTVETLFEDFAASADVREFEILEEYPHEPRMPRHYYAWKSPENYKPNGERLAQLLNFFSGNLADPASRAIMACAIVTPAWGGPCKYRPAFFFDANHRGSGKTTLATVIGNLYGNAISINLDPRGEERLKERLLSPGALHQRIGLVDNVKGSIVSALLDELVTCERISGKRLYSGEASRPNTMVYLITANDARLSPDMARRTFFIQCHPPEYSAAWEMILLEFMKLHAKEVVEDALWILKDLKGPFDWGGIKGETFPLWVQEVMGPVTRCGPVMEVVGDQVAAADVLRWNMARRAETDEELEQAEKFMQGLLERVCAWKGYGGASLARPASDIFIRTEAPPAQPARNEDEHDQQESERRNNMVEYWKAIFQRREVNSTWLARTLKNHILAGRVIGLRQHKERSVGARGWKLSCEVVNDYLDMLAAPAATSTTEPGDKGDG